MTPPTEAERWLHQAQTDLTTSRNLLEDEDFDACSFFCQQVAEKALKAVLYAHGERPYALRNSTPAEHYTAAMAEEALEWAEQLLRFASGHIP